jgi:hypothetical protein
MYTSSVNCVFQPFVDLNFDVIHPTIRQALGISNDGKFSYDLAQSTVSLFGFDSKKARKQLTSYVFLEDIGVINYELATLIYFAGCFAKINRDRLFQSVDRIGASKEGCHEYFGHLNESLVRSLLSYYPEARVVQLLCVPSPLFQDVGIMFEAISREWEKSDITRLLAKKPKSLKVVHDALSRATSRMNADFSLNQREDILVLDNAKLGRGLTIRVPTSHFDLVKVGNALNFCLGNGNYSRGVESGKYAVIVVYKQDKPLYGVQFSQYTIHAAHGFGNSDLPVSIRAELERLLLKLPEIGGDFVPVISSFIKGYRYVPDNSDLFILFGNGNVYRYSDVDLDVYEDFVSAESRGSYFARLIRNVYPSSRMPEIEALIGASLDAA